MRFLLASLSASALLSAAPDARACGGLFCDGGGTTSLGGPPPAQASEQIAFAVADGEVTAHIQIRYEGDPVEFAWILPLPAEPTLEVGTDELFTALGERATPAFSGTLTYTCSSGGGGGGGGDYDDYGCEGEAEAEGESEAESEGEGELPPPVTVEFRGGVGPYDAAVIASDDPDALRAWLGDNGYVVPAAAEPLIDWYVARRMWFVALKLSPTADAGDLAPIVVRFAYDTPCIPLQLTAIAAVPDMRIRAWIFAGARAVPETWPIVEVDWARLGWMCSFGDYWGLVGGAVDEAGGRAFVTEYAGPADVMASALWWEGRHDLAGAAASANAYELLTAVVAQGFARTYQLMATIEALVPPPYGLTFDSWLASLGCDGKGDTFACSNLEDWMADLSAMPIDGAVAAGALDENVVRPLVAAQAMIDAAPMLTTLATVMSPAEMIEDPTFGFRADLPVVDLARAVAVTQTCAASEITLPGGRLEAVGLADDPCATPNADAPVGRLARLLADLPSSEGAWWAGEAGAVALYDNGARIDDLLGAHNIAARSARRRHGCYGDGADDGSDPGDDDESWGVCGCGLGRRAPGAVPRGLALAVLGALAATVARRRRK